MPRLPAALLAALVLAGCGLPSSYGSGPIHLAPQIQAAYDKYRRMPSPGAFAVSRDGSAAGESYCPVGIDCRGNSIAMALEGCRRSHKECYLYDVAGRIVWRDAAPGPGPGPGPGFQPTAVRPALHV